MNLRDVFGTTQAALNEAALNGRGSFPLANARSAIR